MNLRKLDRKILLSCFIIIITSIIAILMIGVQSKPSSMTALNSPVEPYT